MRFSNLIERLRRMISTEKPRYTERQFSEEEKRRLREALKSLSRKRSAEGGEAPAGGNDQSK